mgnify:CR=1 FL=1
MPHARSRFGAAGEDLAAAYLTARGYRVIDRNARTRCGELDLVCMHGRALVFVEVKTRTSAAFGHPEEAITRTKQRHLVRAAAVYVAMHPNLRASPYRIDVVAITMSGVAPDIRHLENAVGEI